MTLTTRAPELKELLGDGEPGEVRSRGEGPSGHVPLTAERLRTAPSGDIFGLTQNAGMGWEPSEAGRTPFLLLLESRSPHPDLAPRPDLPVDTRLWAVLQEASGGIWAGCVYDPDRISKAIE